jgi:hypothetical protein
LDILSGREKCQSETSDFGGLKADVAKVLVRREMAGRQPHDDARLADSDREVFREVFWDLFRQGIITLGCDDDNREFPFFRVTQGGRRMIEGQEPYFFHDVTSYEKIVREGVPKVDDVTVLYLKEAMQAFLSGCILSATVMVGVAAEHAFLSLLEVLDNDPKHRADFKAALGERFILGKLNKFRDAIERPPSALPRSLLEDLDNHLMGIASLIRNYRNESGHPTGRVISREQCYVLLQLFVTYCKKVYQLMEYYRSPGSQAVPSA